MKEEGKLPQRVKVRSSQYLNNLIEQDHRARETTDPTNARVQTIRQCGGDDQRHRVGGEDQEEAIQDWQAGRFRGEHVKAMESGTRCLTLIGSTDIPEQQAMSYVTEFAPEPRKE